MTMPNSEPGARRVHPVVWVLGGAVLGALLLWGASRLDEMDRPTRVSDPAPAGGPADLFVVEIEEERRPVVVIECDEGVHGDANVRFREFLGVEGPPISLPGGPFLLARLPEDWSAEHGPLARSAIEVLKRHGPSRVVLIGHSDCLLYDVTAAWKDQKAFVPLAQAADLAKAARHIRSWLPDARVEAYFARKDGGRIRFNPVTLAEAPEVR